MTRKQALLTYTVGIGMIFILAYLRLIPTALRNLPYYDAAGHFILYGIWGYFFGSAYDKPVVNTEYFSILRGIIFVAVIAVVESFLQRLSLYRTFSLSDLAFGLAGISVAGIILNLTSQNQSKSNQ